MEHFKQSHFDKARDGFIPWTSGGYEICLPATLSHHWGSGSAPAPVQPWLDEGERFIAEEWTRQFPDRPGLVDCICAGEGEPGYQWQSEAENFECEAWSADTDCYFWKARVMFIAPDDRQNESGKPEVYIDAYLNTDLNYGRDHIGWLRCYGTDPNQTIGEFKRTYALSTFARMKPDQLARLAQQAIASLP
jgi:hypothetical protein